MSRQQQVTDLLGLLLRNNGIDVTPATALIPPEELTDSHIKNFIEAQIKDGVKLIDLYFKAYTKGYNKTLKILLTDYREKIDIDALDDQKDTPLHGAIWYKQYQAAQILCEHKIDVNKTSENQQATTPLHLVFSHAGLNDDSRAKFIALLLKYDANVVKKSGENFSILHYFVMQGGLKTCEEVNKILKLHPELLQIRGGLQNRLPITVAANELAERVRQNTLDIPGFKLFIYRIKCLVTDLINDDYKQTQELLIPAVISFFKPLISGTKSTELSEALKLWTTLSDALGLTVEIDLATINEIKVSHQSENSTHKVLKLFEMNSEEFISKYLKDHQKLLSTKDVQGYSIIDHALDTGSLKTLSVLLKNFSKFFSVNGKTQLGTPLQTAIISQRPETVRFLLKEKADPKIKNEQGDALENSVRHASPEIVKLILERYENPNWKLLTKMARKHNRDEIISLLSETKKAQELALKKKPEPSPKIEPAIKEESQPKDEHKKSSNPKKGARKLKKKTQSRASKFGSTVTIALQPEENYPLLLANELTKLNENYAQTFKASFAVIKQKNLIDKFIEKSETFYACDEFKKAFEFFLLSENFPDFSKALSREALILPLLIGNDYHSPNYKTDSIAITWLEEKLAILYIKAEPTIIRQKKILASLLAISGQHILNKLRNKAEKNPKKRVTGENLVKENPSYFEEAIETALKNHLCQIFPLTIKDESFNELLKSFIAELDHRMFPNSNPQVDLRKTLPNKPISETKHEKTPQQPKVSESKIEEQPAKTNKSLGSSSKNTKTGPEKRMISEPKAAVIKSSQQSAPKPAISKSNTPFATPTINTQPLVTVPPEAKPKIIDQTHPDQKEQKIITSDNNHITSKEEILNTSESDPLKATHWLDFLKILINKKIMYQQLSSEIISHAGVYFSYAIEKDFNTPKILQSYLDLIALACKECAPSVLIKNLLSLGFFAQIYKSQNPYLLIGNLVEPVNLAIKNLDQLTAEERYVRLMAILFAVEIYSYKIPATEVENTLTEIVTDQKPNSFNIFEQWGILPSEQKIFLDFSKSYAVEFFKLNPPIVKTVSYPTHQPHAIMTHSYPQTVIIPPTYPPIYPSQPMQVPYSQSFIAPQSVGTLFHEVSTHTQMQLPPNRNISEFKQNVAFAPAVQQLFNFAQQQQPRQQQLMMLQPLPPQFGQSPNLFQARPNVPFMQFPPGSPYTNPNLDFKR